MNRLSNLVLMVCVCFSAHLFADSCVSDDETRTHIYYINGMNTTDEEATSQKIFLETLVQNMFPYEFADKKIQVHRHYNPSEGNHVSGLPGIESFQVVMQRLELGTATSSELREIYRRLTVTRHSELEFFYNTYIDHLEKGHRVIIVGYSQGAMFANQVYQMIKSRKPQHASGVGILTFASPEPQNDVPSIHRTLREDRLINVVRRLSFLASGSVTRTGNMENSTSKEKNFHNHSFIGYMTGDESLREIKTVLKHLYEVIPFPSAETEEGILTAQMRWNANADMDLHVFEPSGSHVYYSDRKGLSGSLDRDDVTGEFPENYFVSCEDLEEGIYTISANYFSGDSPVTATFAMKGGDKTSSASRRFITPNYGELDSSPTKIADVVVVKESDGRFSFDIIRY